MAGLVVGGACLLAWGAARAHDWYPQNCCNGNDCQRARAYYNDEEKAWFAFVKEHGIFEYIPPSQVRMSPVPPDGMCHVCYKVNHMGGTNFYCFFPCAPKS